MMNRPRPRKIINVIKTSPSAEIEEKSTLTELSKNSMPFEAEKKPILNSKPESNMANTSTNPVNFIPRKPIVATLKKAHIPPPPTFSDSPKASPTQPEAARSFDNPEMTAKTSPNEQFKSSIAPTLEPQNSIGNLAHFKSQSQTSVIDTHKSPPSENFNRTLSPKSSGEVFLDAADKAADFISGALLNSFKGFNLSDTSSVKISSPIPMSSNESLDNQNDDPFADIMKKLKPTSAPISKSSPNLMDEEPPESFKLSTEPIEISNCPETIEPISKVIKDIPTVENSEPVASVEPRQTTEVEFTAELNDETEIDSTSKASTNVFLDDEDDYLNYESNNSSSAEYENSKVQNAKDDVSFLVNESNNHDNNFNHRNDSDNNPKWNNESPTNASEKIVSDCPNPYAEEQPVYNKASRSENDGLIETSPEISSPVVNTFTSPSVSIPKSNQNTFITPPSNGNIFNPPSNVNTFTASTVNNLTPSAVANSSTSTIPFFDSISSLNSANISDQSLPRSISPTNSAKGTTGFRASLLKHGLSALEKIGKSTADVVVSTRNKLSEPNNFIETNSTNVITPDFTDETSSFQDILRLYGGNSKLQELQIKAIKSSIAMKLERKTVKIDKSSTFDYQSRLRLRRQIAEILHPDRIMDNIDDNEVKNSIFFADVKFPILSKSCEDEIFCIQRLLKSLDNILIMKSPNMEESILISSNRRRHVICQISTVFTTMLNTILSLNDPVKKANEISSFATEIIKYLQANFSRNCEGYPRADRDQQVAIKLILDLSYSIVPQLQQQL